MHEAVRELEPRDAAGCDAIVAGLPEWFGNERGIRERDVAEITWMAVRADLRRHGVGRSLLGALIDRLREEQVRRLDVKTLSERATYAPYEETRGFYLANGFESVAELDIWEEENPAVLLRRSL
jgi:GNAT superfamily N-acetyltransferase